MKPMIFVLVALLMHEKTQAQGDAFADEAKRLVSKQGQKVAISLRDDQGTEVFTYQGGLALAPASIAKTVSTACSLDALGPHFQFETSFGALGKIQGDVLDGDLVVQGTGDPSLVIEDLHEVIEKIRFVHGIRKITGAVLFDVSYLGQKSVPMAPGFEGDEGRSFTADLTPVIFNQNSFSVWVAPDVRNGVSTRVATLPAGVVDIELQNKTRVGGATDLSLAYDPKAMRATLVGTMARTAEPKGIYRAVDDSYGYAANVLHRLWTDSGGEWKKPAVKISTSAVSSNLLYKYQSRPLAKIMMDVNKFSLNLGAEMIFLAAGAEQSGRPATYGKSLSLLKDCIATHGATAEGIALTNASGLSREARIKPSALTLFLSHYEKSFYAPEYLSSFGLLGIDGTAKSRLKNHSGRARIKTGSLKDVRSIAGYLSTKEGKRYSFTMIQNGVNPNDAKALEDGVIASFMRNY